MAPEADKNEPNLWAQVLEEVSGPTNRRRRGKPKSLLVLGDEGCGKSALISSLQGKKPHKDGPQGTGLGFTSLEIKDEDSEVRVGVYTLDGDYDQATLLETVVKKDNLDDVFAMIVVDISQPWHIKKSLEKWSGILAGHLAKLDAESELESLKQKQVHFFQTYTEDSEETKKDKDGGEEDAVVLDLDEGVLATNLGIPLIVAVTKDDCVESLSQDRSYRQEHLDFIQLHIRKFCLEYGAGLVYTGKAQKTKEALYRYLAHIAVGAPFTHKACIAEADGIFIPRGWDNPTKINVLTDSFSTIKAESPYEEVIVEININVSKSAKEIIAEDEQTFLDKQRHLLARGETSDSGSGGGSSLPPAGGSTTRATGTPPITVGSASPSAGRRARPHTTRSTTTSRDTTASTLTPKGSRDSPSARPTAGGRSTPARTTNNAKGGETPKDADVLANFFNSLLGNATPPGGAAGAPRGAGSRAEAAKEAINKGKSDA